MRERQTRDQLQRMDLAVNVTKKTLATILETVAFVVAIGAIGIGLAVAALTDDLRVAAGAAGIAGFGTLILVLYAAFDLLHKALDKLGEPDPEPAPGATIGGDVRRASSEGQIRFLRERGFDVPPEPERGALSKWLWAVVDERVTFSQRGAIAAVRDTPEMRTWAKDVMALWCEANWARPANGWQGDVPDLGNGVRDVNTAMIARCASEGQTGLINALIELVEDDFDERQNGQNSSPYSEAESEHHATG